MPGLKSEDRAHVEVKKEIPGRDNTRYKQSGPERIDTLGFLEHKWRLL